MTPFVGKERNKKKMFSICFNENLCVKIVFRNFLKFFCIKKKVSQRKIIFGWLIFLKIFPLIFFLK